MRGFIVSRQEGVFLSQKRPDGLWSTPCLLFNAYDGVSFPRVKRSRRVIDRSPAPCAKVNPLSPELNPICYLLALLAHHFLHVSRIRVKSLTLRPLMSHIYIYICMYVYGAPIPDVSRSHTTTQHSR
jgi:hypothetical protein